MDNVVNLADYRNQKFKKEVVIGYISEIDYEDESLVIEFEDGNCIHARFYDDLPFSEGDYYSFIKQNGEYTFLS